MAAASEPAEGLGNGLGLELPLRRERDVQRAGEPTRLRPLRGAMAYSKESQRFHNLTILSCGFGPCRRLHEPASFELRADLSNQDVHSGKLAVRAGPPSNVSRALTAVGSRSPLDQRARAFCIVLFTQGRQDLDDDPDCRNQVCHRHQNHISAPAENLIGQARLWRSA